MARPDDWSDDEIILAIATCPRAKQSYSPRHKNVIELADLIGRTTGAVSHHFANISNLIHGGDHGETHVGRRFRELFEEYAGRDAELQAKAVEIRRRFMAQDLTPRVEKQVPKDKTKQLTLDVYQAARDAGLPEGGVETYEREGSWYFGILVQLNLVLSQYPTQAAHFLQWIAKNLGEGLSHSKGFELVVQGHLQELADEVLAKEAPELHVAEVEPPDRATLALGVVSLGSLKGWKPKIEHIDFLSNMNRDAERARIAEYFKIDPAGLCDHCLLMLTELVDRSLKKKHP